MSFVAKIENTHDFSEKIKAFWKYISFRKEINYFIST